MSHKSSDINVAYKIEHSILQLESFSAVLVERSGIRLDDNSDVSSPGLAPRPDCALSGRFITRHAWSFSRTDTGRGRPLESVRDGSLADCFADGTGDLSPGFGAISVGRYRLGRGMSLEKLGGRASHALCTTGKPDEAARPVALGQFDEPVEFPTAQGRSSGERESAN